MERYKTAEQEAAEQQKDYERLIADTKKMLDTESGRRVIWHILSACGVYDGTCTGDAQTFFLQGRRDIGLMVIGLLSDVGPTTYPELQIRMAKDARN